MLWIDFSQNPCQLIVSDPSKIFNQSTYCYYESIWLHWSLLISLIGGCVCSIFVDGCEPFSEDLWTQLKINDLTFHGVKLCSRCKVGWRYQRQSIYSSPTNHVHIFPSISGAHRQSRDGSIWHRTYWNADENKIRPSTETIKEARWTGENKYLVKMSYNISSSRFILRIVVSWSSYVEKHIKPML